MAQVVPHLNRGAFDTQNSNERDHARWEHARPKNEQDAKPSLSKTFALTSNPAPDNKSDYSRPSSKANGRLQRTNSSSQLDRDNSPHNPPKPPSSDSTYLSPHQPIGSRPTLSDISRSGSEPDSLLDLYGRPRSNVGSMDRPERGDGGEALYFDDEDPESSRWIHRDKLALIESHEMREAGITLPEPARSRSKSSGRRNHSRGKQSDEVNEQDQISHRPEQARRQGPSPPPPQGGDRDNQGDSIEIDLRTSAEIVAESYAVGSTSPVYRHQGLRTSSSRIPLPKSSHMPIPQEHIERNIPLPRKRGTSGNWSGGDEESIRYIKTRGRSQSVGSQVLSDEADPLNDVTNLNNHLSGSNSPSTSPSKRPASKASTVTSINARKAAAALRNASDTNQPKPRILSNNYRSSPNQRPKSRSGIEPRRAVTVNRPEGDPPWLATMYKPDPRLHPDQQLLPTHVKRLKEGGPALGPDDGLDTNESAVARREASQHQYRPPSDGTFDLEKEEVARNDDLSRRDESGWPLKSSPTGLRDNGSPTLSITEHGGYSTVPKVQSPPLPIGSAPNPKPSPQLRHEEKEKENGVGMDKKEKDGGCACCITM